MVSVPDVREINSGYRLRRTTANPLPAEESPVNGGEGAPTDLSQLSRTPAELLALANWGMGSRRKSKINKGMNPK